MPFDTFLEEVVEWPSYFGEIGDKTSVEVGKSLESPIFRDISGHFPFANTWDFDWIHHDGAIFYDYSKELDPLSLENALAGFQV